MFVAEPTFHDRETEYETDCASFRSDGRACRLCDDTSAASDADVPGWIGDPGDRYVPGSAATASAAATGARARLSGRNGKKDRLGRLARAGFLLRRR